MQVGSATHQRSQIARFFVCSVIRTMALWDGVITAVAPTHIAYSNAKNAFWRDPGLPRCLKCFLPALTESFSEFHN